jgi:prolyl-tRNA synthetase
MLMSEVKITIAKRETNYPQWYLDICKYGELYENSPTPGCITFLPKSVSIWEKITAELDSRFKSFGVKNLLLPTLIPMEYFHREKDFVDGFSPEFAVVTHGGGKELENPLVYRPTSEMMFCEFFSRRLHTHNDLPMLYNQWGSVIRWEKRPRPFLRTMEFHWQEGHTLHETKDEAKSFATTILNDAYIDVINNVLAIDGIPGYKPDSEKFAGAETTMTYEPMMSNGWALQICTSHVLGDGFTSAFDLKFQNKNKEIAIPAYTSWGFSTRTIGGMVSSHSDGKGLIIPPKLSEYTAVLMPINPNIESVQKLLIDVTRKLIVDSEKITDTQITQKKQFSLSAKKQSILIDNRDIRIGPKLFDWELSGYPLAIKFGEKETTSSTVILVNRATGTNRTISASDVAKEVSFELTEIQNYLYSQSSLRLRNNTVFCDTAQEVVDIVKQGKFAAFSWDGNRELEEYIKQEASATIRCIPFKDTWVDVKYRSKIAGSSKLVIIARSF